jgi:hypothetical protein
MFQVLSIQESNFPGFLFVAGGIAANKKGSGF